MFVLKHVPEDFVVTEVSTVEPGEAGEFLYFRLWKKGLSTLDAVTLLSKVWAVPVKRIAFAGIKDKRAVTEQVCSVKGVSKVRVEKTDLENVTVKVLGFGDEPVHVGALEGNQFKIVVRNIDKLPESKSRFRNLFGEQRFSEKNVEIGRHIVKREFEEAVKLILNQNPPFKEKILQSVEKNDWVGALRRMPFRVLKLFVHAFQSFVWNEAAMISNREVLPIVGFGTQEVDEVTQSILDREGVKLSDFVIREIPDISAEGSERPVWIETKVTIGELEDDDVFSGKFRTTVEFFLPKGAYATTVVAQLFQ